MKTTSAALLLLLLLLAGEMTTMHALVTEHHRVHVEGPAGRVNAKGSSWVKDFHRRLQAERLSPLQLVEERATVSTSEPLTVLTVVLLVVVTAKLAARLVRMAREWNTLIMADVVHDRMASMALRDFACRASVDQIRMVKLLGENTKLLESLEKQVFPVDTCMARLRIAKERIGTMNLAERFTNSIIPHFFTDGAAKQKCEELAATIASAKEQVKELAQKAEERATKACQMGNAPVCKDESKWQLLGQDQSQIMRECAVSNARMDYVRDVNAATGSPSGPTSMKAFASPTFDKLKLVELPGTLKFSAGAAANRDRLETEARTGRKDPGAERKKAYEEAIANGKSKAEATGKANDAEQAAKWKNDDIYQGLQLSVLTITAGALDVLDTVGKAIATHFITKNIENESSKVLTAACSVRMGHARLLNQIEQLQRTQEDLWDALDAFARSSDQADNRVPSSLQGIWGKNDVLIMRKLYARFRGNAELGSLVSDENWRKQRCVHFFQHYVLRSSAAEDSATGLADFTERCGALLEHVAKMADPAFSEMDAYLVLFADEDPGDPRSTRFQRALFNQQRVKLAETWSKVPSDLRSLGCLPFQPLQIEFERQLSFLESEHVTATNPPKPTCQVGQLATCVAAYHHARCYPEHNKDVGNVLKRAYQIYRHDYPFQSSLPIQGDPFIATDGLKATVREYQFQAYALALGDSSDVDRVVKKYHKSVTGATGVAPLADADKVDMKKKVVTTAGARSQFVDKVEGARLEQSDELAGETANFAENVVHVLGACGTIFSQTCAHHDKLVSWMSATDGPFRAALGFGDLSWLGASLYAPAGYARAYFLPAGNTGDIEFFPLGCTRELPLSGLLHVPQLHESLQPQNNKPPELHQDPIAQVMTHGGEADPDIKLDKHVIKADDDLELELRKLKLKEHQAHIEQMKRERAARINHDDI